MDDELLSRLCNKKNSEAVIFKGPRKRKSMEEVLLLLLLLIGATKKPNRPLKYLGIVSVDSMGCGEHMERLKEVQRNMEGAQSKKGELLGDVQYGYQYVQKH